MSKKELPLTNRWKRRWWIGNKWSW